MLRYSLYRNAKLHFRDKDDIVENNCNNINANVCHYPPCNSTRLDFRQKLNRLQSPLIRHVESADCYLRAYSRLISGDIIYLKYDRKYIICIVG